MIQTNWKYKYAQVLSQYKYWLQISIFSLFFSSKTNNSLISDLNAHYNLNQVKLQYIIRAVRRSIIGGRGEFSIICVRLKYFFFWIRLFLRSVKTNINNCPPPPPIIDLRTALYTFQFALLVCIILFTRSNILRQKMSHVSIQINQYCSFIQY